MGYKYIIIRKGNQELPIIFPDSMVHKLVFQAIRAMTRAELRMMAPMLSEEALTKGAKSVEIVSAGSITFDVGTVDGFSETLGVKSRPSDGAMIQRFPYTHGII